MYRWQLRGIRYFSAAEVEGTGADLADVKRRLLVALDKFRAEIGRRVFLLPNGMTTGQHQSWTHPAGLAADIAFYEAEGPVHVQCYVMTAIACGFRGVGVYWNGTAYSMHLDLGPPFRQWARWRHHGEKMSAMRTIGLIVDPGSVERAAQ